MMSAPIAFWISIDSRGPRRIRDPSTNERNVTPPSSRALMPLIENAWKPPESVSIGPSQRMKRWLPPTARIRSTPTRTSRW